MRVSLFSDPDRKRITPWCIGLILEASEQLSEGEVRSEASGQEIYFGSTMLTCDLNRLAGRIREKINPELPDLLSRALSSSPLFHTIALRIGRIELERRIGNRLPSHAEGDVRIKPLGCSLLIDIDTECRLASPHSPSRKKGYRP